MLPLFKNNTYTQFDYLNKVDYQRTTVSLFTLRDFLISQFSLSGITVDEMNANSGNEFPEEVTEEVYEYNEIILGTKGDTLHLIDGYKRLFVISPSKDIEVKVRIYDLDKMSNEAITRMLISLNYQKAFNNSLGLLTDRGVSLFMKSFFNIHITSILEILQFYIRGYCDSMVDLESRGISRFNYSSKSKVSCRYNQVRKTFLSKNLITDLKTLQELNDSWLPHKGNLGAIIGLKRQVDSDFIVDIKKLETYLSDKESFKHLIEKHNRTNVFDARTYENSNIILEAVSNAIDVLYRGKEGVISWPDVLLDFDKKIKDLKKQGYKKVGSKNCYSLEPGQEVIVTILPYNGLTTGIGTNEYLKTEGEFLKAMFVDSYYRFYNRYYVFEYEDSNNRDVVATSSLSKYKSIKVKNNKTVTIEFYAKFK